jgi:uncharacterized protein
LNLSEPLSDEELQELEDFLLAAENDACMDLSMLDGFLTALAVGPNTLPPSRWLPLLWGGEARWQSKEQAERILSLVFRHANAILFYLRDDPDVFEPILYEQEEDGRQVPLIDDWCSGFVAGMALDEAGWQPLLEAEAGDDLLYPILLYGTEDGWEARQAHPELEGRLQDMAAALGDCVMGIHDWWLPQRKANSTLRREEPKVGRNDLCPCGSGRKYKRCCGAPEKLH